MSNLKHLSLSQLLDARKSCDKYIGNMKQNIHNQGVKLHWIDYYIQSAGGETYVPNEYAPTPELMVNRKKRNKTISALREQVKHLEHKLLEKDRKKGFFSIFRKDK